MIVRRIQNNELYHHGVKGQKWGKRRYQNEDGSLTAEGKKRYGTVENFEKAQKKKIKMVVRRLQENPNELYHHGIKGQRWGVRRYQNPDGSLTDVGRKHIKKDAKKIKQEGCNKTLT